MRIRQVSVRNYRGIRHMDWKLEEPITCLIGPGDSTKSTILDAIELALSPRWNVTFDDSDFHNTDTSQDIEITVTVGDLPDALMTEQKFGLYTRGWKADSGLVDEPEDDCEGVLSIQLRVSGSLELNGRLSTTVIPKAVSFLHEIARNWGLFESAIT